MERSAGEAAQISVDAPSQVADTVKGKPVQNEDSGAPNEEMIRTETAAVEMQRVFRGHRARRNIADAATMAHKFGWWNVVDGAVLQHHSSNFYAYNTPQNASQRWLRLKKKAAKVGKGLSKNEKARKLAIQHWLEAIDPKHRYGHNLHIYYEVWDSSQTQEPFFYWLDIGEGKDINLDHCKRSKLQKELIRYLSPEERKWFEVEIKNGKLYKKMTGEPVNTPKGDKWIFVMSTTGKLYVGKKEKGKLQHSSFLAGGATTAAGRLLVKDGTIEVMEAHSGHYHPTPEDFDRLVSILRSSGADLTMAKVQVVSDDMISDILSMKSNSAKSIGVDPEIQLDVPVILEDTQKLDVSNEDRSSKEVASLDLDDDLNASGVDEVALVEKSFPERTHSENRNVVIEGLELLNLGGSMDASGIWDQLEGMKVEIIQPGKSSQFGNPVAVVQEVNSSGGNATAKQSPKVLRTSPSLHRLFGPALQTLSKLEDRASVRSTDLHDSRTENTVELTPDKKLSLLRMVSISRPMGTSS